MYAHEWQRDCGYTDNSLTAAFHKYVEREIVIFNTQKSHFRDGDDAEYFETATENPLQHTANASAIRGMHIWKSPTPAAPV